ncbi:MAG: GAF domain-containing protein [Anaerolineae bacterium]|nr:GAF domain-containing protein [Anaerolineae bacterium]
MDIKPTPRRRLTVVSIKLLVAVVLAIVVITAVQTWLTLREAQQRGEDQSQTRLDASLQDFNNEIGLLQRGMSGMAASFADRPDIKTALIQEDREALLTILQPIFLQYRAAFQMSHFFVYDSRGRVFLQVDDPENYGSSSAERPLIAAVMNVGVPIGGIAVDATHVGVRGAAPLIEQGELVGIVEIDLAYDHLLVDDLKTRNDLDYTIWITSDIAEPVGLQALDEDLEAPIPELVYYASTHPNLLPISDSIYRDVLKTAESQVIFERDDGKSYAVMVAPFTDYRSETLGLVEIVEDRTESLDALTEDRLTTLAVSGGLLLLGIGFILLFHNRVISRPLADLTEVAERISHGDLEARVTVLPNDEFGRLGHTVNTMTMQLSDLVNNLEERVNARTHDLQLASQVIEEVATVLDPDDLLRLVVDLTKDRFNLYHAHIYLLDETRENLVLAAGSGEAGRVMLDHGHHIPCSTQNSLVMRAVRTNAAVVVDDVSTAPDFMPNPLLPLTRSEVAQPLSIGTRVLGVLDVQSEHEAHFTEDMQMVLATLTRQVATALDNARLFSEIERVGRHEQALSTITHEIQSASNMEEVLQIAARELGRALNVPHTAIELQMSDPPPDDHSPESDAQTDSDSAAVDRETVHD